MSKSFTNTTLDALAQATQAAALRMSSKSPKQPQPEAKAAKVQFNILLSAAARTKLRNAAFAWNTTERELIEQFAAQLPDVQVPVPDAPEGLAWAKPK